MAKRMKLDENKAIFQINSLPNEVLIEIFYNFDLDDRNSASLVCKKWLNLFSTQPLVWKFPIVLQGSLRMDTPPISVLLNGERKFPCLGIDSNLQIEQNFNSCLSLLDALGQNVRCLFINHINSSDKILNQILKKCHNLETLTIPLNYAFKKLENMPRSLKAIKIDCRDSLYFNREAKIMELKSYNTNLTLKNIKFALHDLSRNMNFIVIDEELVSFAQTNWQNAAIFEVYRLNVIKDQPLHFKHFEKITLRDTILPGLALFTNLKSLHFSFPSCAGFHTVTSMLKIDTFYLNQPELCLQCLDAALDSFPNLNKLGIQSLKLFTEDHFKLLSTKACHIKKLMLRVQLPCTKINTHILESFTELNELDLMIDFQICPNFSDLPKLETLSIQTSQRKQIFNQRSMIRNTLDSLANKVPNLTNLTVAVEFLTIPTAICVLKQFPKLKKFKLELELTEVQSYDFTRERIKFFKNFDKLIDVIILHGKCLTDVEFYSENFRTIKSFDLRKERPDWVDKMFSAMDKLDKVVILFDSFRKFTRYHTLVLTDSSGI